MAEPFISPMDSLVGKAKPISPFNKLDQPLKSLWQAELPLRYLIILGFSI